VYVITQKRKKKGHRGTRKVTEGKTNKKKRLPVSHKTAKGQKFKGEAKKKKKKKIKLGISLNNRRKRGPGGPGVYFLR